MDEEIEGNELIKNFMQLEISKGVLGDTRIYYKINLTTHQIIAPEGGFLYHLSFDWLHPAWEKFRDMKLDLTNEKFCEEWNKHCQNISTAIHAYPINIVFGRLVKAIKFINSNK